MVFETPAPAGTIITPSWQSTSYTGMQSKSMGRADGQHLGEIVGGRARLSLCACFSMLLVVPA